MHGHQDRNHERDADAVQHVEAQQRAFADERSAEQREPRIVVPRESAARRRAAAATAPGPS